MRTRAEISCGAIFLPWASSQASPFSARTILYGLERDVLLDHCVVEAAADQALDRVERVLRVGDGLALGRLADQGKKMAPPEISARVLMKMKKTAEDYLGERSPKR